MALQYSSTQDFADEVLAALKDAGLSREWLSRQTGIPSSTLRTNLSVDPTTLSFLNAIRISVVLDLLTGLAQSARGAGYLDGEVA